MSQSYASAVGTGYQPTPDEPVLDSLFSQYERVIVESLLTSFGLDMFIRDQHGGDVDTIHNVRQIGTDPQMQYKNARNIASYEERGAYNQYSYHGGDSRYRSTIHNTRQGTDTGTTTDAYTGRKVAFSKAASPDQKASLDHVVAAKEIHDDRGRVLAGLRGEDLANSPENLRFTNQSLNSSMQEKDIETYVKAHPELPQEQKERMLKEYNQAKKSYDDKLKRAYYTSSAFRKDMAVAAASTAAKMGLRQMAGFAFAEIWFAVKEEFQKAAGQGIRDLGILLTNIGNGIKRGVENLKTKYKELWAKFAKGALAGALSSVTTTLCNIFFTTAKNVVRLIRQTYASLVEACKILFINPDNLPFGQRMNAAAKVLAAGASIVAGTIVQETIQKTPVGTIPIVGEVISVFCGTVVTGIMTCSLLYFLDHGEMIQKLVGFLDNLHFIDAEIDYFRSQATHFEAFAAKLENIDLEKFRIEITTYRTLVDNLEVARTEVELNAILQNAVEAIGVIIPWGEGNFNSFMLNRSRTLVFQ